MSYSENFLFDADVNHFHNLKLNKEIRVFHLGFCLWYIAKRVNSSSMECDTYPDVTIQCHFFGSEGLYFLCSVCPFQVQLHQIFKLSWAREFKSNILCLVSAKYGCTRYFWAIFSCSVSACDLGGHKVEFSSYTIWHQSPESGGSHYLNSSPDLDLNLVLKLLEIKSPRPTVRNVQQSQVCHTKKITSSWKQLIHLF